MHYQPAMFDCTANDGSAVEHCRSKIVMDSAFNCSLIMDD